MACLARRKDDEPGMSEAAVMKQAAEREALLFGRQQRGFIRRIPRSHAMHGEMPVARCLQGSNDVGSRCAAAIEHGSGGRREVACRCRAFRRRIDQIAGRIHHRRECCRSGRVGGAAPSGFHGSQIRSQDDRVSVEERLA